MRAHLRLQREKGDTSNITHSLAKRRKKHTLWLSWHMVCACWQLAYTNTTHPKLQLITSGTTHPVETEVECNTKEKADRRKGAYKNCNNVVKKKVRWLCWPATDLKLHFSHCTADWVLLILNGLTAKTTVYADFVCSQVSWYLVPKSLNWRKTVSERCKFVRL